MSTFTGLEGRVADGCVAQSTGHPAEDGRRANTLLEGSQFLEAPGGRGDPSPLRPPYTPLSVSGCGGPQTEIRDSEILKNFQIENSVEGLENPADPQTRIRALPGVGACQEGSEGGGFRRLIRNLRLLQGRPGMPRLG